MFFAVLGAFVLLTLVSFYHAYGMWEAPIPGMLLDPLGHVSAQNWPGYAGAQQGLSYPDAVLLVDQRPLPAAPALHPLSLPPLGEVVRRSPAGTPLDLVMDVRGERVRVHLRVEALGWLPWLVLYGCYVVVAWIWLLAAGFSYLVRPGSSGVQAFVRWSLINVVLLLTMFDYNTTRALVPLWVLAYGLLPGAVLELGLSFPDEVPLLRQVPGLRWVPRVISAGVLLWVTVAFYLGRLEQLELVAQVLGWCILVMVMQMLYRGVVARGRKQRQLLAGLSWMPFYLIVGLLLIGQPRQLSAWVFSVVVPLHGLATLGLLYAMIRFDLWDSRVLLERRRLRPVLSGVLTVVGGLSATILFVLLVERGVARAGQIGVVLLLTTLAVPVQRWLDRWLDRTFFPAESSFRPTVEQLSLRFIDLGSSAAVVEAVESTVRQWLPVERVKFLPLPRPVEPRGDDSSELLRSLPPVAQAVAHALVTGAGGMTGGGSSLNLSTLNPSTLAGGLPEPPEWRVLRRAARAAGIPGVGTEQAASLCRGETVHPQGTDPVQTASLRAMWAQVLIPARFREEVVGLLAVSPKRLSQLFTSEDEDLLRTIANLAALALACAHLNEQVEALRRAQQAAFREEKGAAVGTVAAEIAHEIRPIVNFFRVMMESCAVWLREGQPPDAEDVEIGRGEVERLERMAGNLKRIATGRALERTTVDLRALVDHVRLLLRDRLAGRHLEVAVDPLLDVNCDRDALTQILVNLIGNALDACKLQVGVGVTAEALDDGRLRLTVWDRGPGPLPDLGKMFQPWFTTKASGTGLGLPITRRLVRAHGWEISAARRGDRTAFEVMIPLDEWRRRPPPPPEEEKFDSNSLK